MIDVIVPSSSGDDMTVGSNETMHIYQPTKQLVVRSRVGGFQDKTQVSAVSGVGASQE